MMHFILTVAALGIAIPATAAEIVWKDVSVMMNDGDSGYVVQPITGQIKSIRLTDYDTAEPSKGHAQCHEERLSGIKAGIEAQRLVTTHTSDVVWQDNNGDGVIDLDKYKRGLGMIRLHDQDGKTQTLYAALVGSGHALPYGGTGRRPDWCKWLELQSTLKTE